MVITFKTTTKVTFQVVYHEDGESGMNSDSFGQVQEELKDALRILEVAKVQYPDHEWFIACDVETKVS